MKHHTPQKQTFAQILNETRLLAAATAWQRARLASRLRHIAKRQGRNRSARKLSTIKSMAIARAIEIAPAKARITIDKTVSPYVLCIGLGRLGRLHLPMNHCGATIAGSNLSSAQLMTHGMAS